MSKRRFSPKQIKELRQNKCVAKCSDKAITYSKDFKVKAVHRFEDAGASAKQIFADAGLPANLVGQHTAKNCIRSWARLARIKGIESLAVETRGRGGGRPKTKNVTAADKIKRLEAKVAYLKAENDFLAALRAKRAE